MMISSLLFLFPRIVVWKVVCYPVLLCLLCFILQFILTDEPKNHPNVLDVQTYEGNL
jgi:hypothetical protein